mmetsp:Transcript_30556/g.94968  ORF Transcript_30556/g.94968 Transcript_30556/m.94968 type:complete len:204 (-) Transcript_30556:415-1026(-)
MYLPCVLRKMTFDGSVLTGTGAGVGDWVVDGAGAGAGVLGAGGVVDGAGAGAGVLGAGGQSTTNLKSASAGGDRESPLQALQSCMCTACLPCESVEWESTTTHWLESAFKWMWPASNLKSFLSAATLPHFPSCNFPLPGAVRQYSGWPAQAIGPSKPFCSTNCFDCKRHFADSKLWPSGEKLFMWTSRHWSGCAAHLMARAVA